MPRLRDEDPPSLPLLVRRPEALAAGLTDGQVNHRLRIGAWRRVAPGTYLRLVEPRDAIAAPGTDADGSRPPDPAQASRFEASRDEHLRRAVAAAAKRGGLALAGRSAALALGLPLVQPFGARDPVELIALEGAGAPHRGVRSGQRVLTGSVAAGACARVAGVPVTDAATTIRLVAARDRADGLAAADGALRSGSLVPAELRALASCARPGIPGSARIRWVAGHADGRRESALESWSWERMDAWRLPMPRIQAEIVDGSGRFVARVDALWEGQLLVGEADGRLKYAGADDLYREKRREDRLRALGFQVIRWSWSDLADERRLRRELERRLGRGTA